MQNKIILISSLLLASSAVMAEQSLLEAAGKQVAKDAVTTAAPEVVKVAETANQTLENAKDIKQSVVNAPAVAQEQAKEQLKDAVQQKIEQATPQEVTQGVETLKAGKETAKQIKGTVDAAPKSTQQAIKTVEGKAKAKATEKALDLLR